MRLKTYRAPDLSTALALARSEAGPDALVLATSEIPGRMGLTCVEVTVAVEAEPVDPAAALASTRARDRSRPDPTSRAQPVVQTDEIDEAALERAVAVLVEGGVSRDLALRFGRIAGTRSAADVTGLVAGALERIVPFRLPPLAGRTLFVVGPPGAGKSATVAKLAARIVLEERRPALIAQADLERIGSLEQTQIYSRCLDVPHVAVRDARDLVAARRAAGADATVLVDTAGVGASDPQRRTLLDSLRAAAPDAEMALIVPNGIHETEARRVLERFGPLRPTCVALSKLDDGSRPGEVLGALAPRRLPLAFLTHGHRVPDDLLVATPVALAGLLVRDPWQERPA